MTTPEHLTEFETVKKWHKENQKRLDEIGDDWEHEDYEYLLEDEHILTTALEDLESVRDLSKKIKQNDLTNIKYTT